MFKKLLLLTVVTIFSAATAQNNYLDFDGIDDSVIVPNASNLVANATAVSMSCKVFPRRISSGFPDFNGFAGFRNEANFDFYLIQLSSSDVEARFRNSDGIAFTITYTGLTLNEWTQFFLVYNGSTLKLYANDVEVGSIPAFGSVPAASLAPADFQIGVVTYQAFNWYHDGKIDEVSLWDRELSPGDITAIVADGEVANASAETNLKLYYKFDQGIPYGDNLSETTLTDVNATNGTLLNFALTGNSSNWGSDQLALPGYNRDRVALYPNPATTTISISGLEVATDYRIVDVSGRIVANGIVSVSGSIDVSKLTSGLYFANIDSNRLKFIVR
ncbi:MAG: T9SS type A sorting domain-containing protein [Flavobacterium sp.]|nr:MAG: T9SS type A sorting domain-containing protein [Flavobacterium sp.]